MIIIADVMNVTESSVTQATTVSIREECAVYHDLEAVLSPYAFPMLIEYCAVSATMLLVMWENSGVGFDPDDSHHKTASVSFSLGKSEGKDEASDGDNTTSRLSSKSSDSLTSISRVDSGTNLSSILSPTYEVKASKHYNSFRGFVLGWTVICGTSSVTILCLYDLYTRSGETPVPDVAYGLNAALSASCTVTSIITFFSLSKLTFEDQEAINTVHNEKGMDPAEYQSKMKQKMEAQLGIVTLLALISWKIFSIIAAFDNNDGWILVDGIVAVVFGMTQNLFLAYAVKKRTKTNQQLVSKPGRQGLEFLRLANFALWLNNTFLLKHPRAKSVMNTTFGEMEWAVLSNVFQPLAILYYFHSMIIITETIHQVYTSKFVGVVRQSKQLRQRLTKSGEVDNLAFA